MRIKVFADKSSTSRAAAEQAAGAIRRAIAARRHARIVAATAASQTDFLDALSRATDIDWAKVEIFHLDEYVGLPITHPGSFRKMLLEQLIAKTGATNYHLLEGDAADPAEVARGVSRMMAAEPVDIAFLGMAKTATSPSTIRLPISAWKNPISSSSSTKPAGSSRLGKPGFRTSPRYRGRRSRCRCGRS